MSKAVTITQFERSIEALSLADQLGSLNEIEESRRDG
jgi:hypothetical protein